MGGSLKGEGTMARKPAAKKAPAVVKAETGARKEAVEAQFAETDAKGEPDEQAAFEAQRARSQVTGL
jgi:hypothetical protein